MTHDSGLQIGSVVHTPLGRGMVRAVRNGGRLLVEVKGRSVVFSRADVSVTAAARPVGHAGGEDGREPPSRPPDRPGRRRWLEVDLHGLSVEEAVSRMEQALSDALLWDVAELRVIHGRSGGRIRVAVHARLRAIPTVRYEVDRGNPGVTIVRL
ncbi:MAG: hypothetical protein FJW23_16250 [Acidimicrobiia bacterium]|nr:hypothetical protein [Acidimicrobiia bacterium]